LFYKYDSIIGKIDVNVTAVPEAPPGLAPVANLHQNLGGLAGVLTGCVNPLIMFCCSVYNGSVGIAPEPVKTVGAKVRESLLSIIPENLNESPLPVDVLLRATTPEADQVVPFQYCITRGAVLVAVPDKLNSNVSQGLVVPT
jgi:hypothetical protein